MSAISPQPVSDQTSTDELLQRFKAVRQFSQLICEPLEIEDFVVQSMPDVSPTRWHLAHTTWFFETFVLATASADYQYCCPEFNYLFNSYYNTVGKQFPRSQRGLLTRPTVREVFDYRREVDERLLAAFDSLDESQRHVIELGIQHEQQHQELMLTDIKHVLSCNPLYPAYHQRPPTTSAAPGELRFADHDGGVLEIGHTGEGFSYDNEHPRHEALVHPFQFSNRLITNGEFLEFVEDGGYRRPELWLSMGWSTVEAERWTTPLYWVREENQWQHFTLAGLQPLVAEEPVCHVSYFEADAFARWRGSRLPTEFEWEAAVHDSPSGGNFADSMVLHPQPATEGDPQHFGDVWEWTASQYVAYPGYRPPAGAIGEYNGKFMCNQFVLRGGSCATSQSHIRTTYRNFFPPEARWQFSGIRLAKDS